MRKLIFFFLFFFILLFPVFSENDYIINVSETNNLRLSQSYEEEKAFMFLIGYEVVLQDRLPAAFLVYDDISHSFIGCCTSVTSDGFFDKQHSENIAVLQALPCDVLILMFQALNDLSTVSYLKEFDSSQLMATAIIFRPNKDFSPVDTVDFLAIQALQKSIIGHGLDIDNFFQMASNLNIDRSDLLSVIESGDKSPSEVVEDVMLLKNLSSGQEIKDSSINISIIIVFSIAIVVLLSSLVIYLFYISNKTNVDINNENKKSKLS